MKTVLKKLVRQFWGSSVYARCLLAHDQIVSWRVTGTRKPDRILLIAPSGGGNIGDQAMFEAVLANTFGLVHVVFSAPNALRIPPAEQPRVRVTVLEKLIRGQIVLRIRAVRAYARELARATAVLIPGADTVDGGHAHNSLSRLNLAHLAAARGIPTAVQGFSWSPDAPRSVTWSATKMAPAVDLCPRDPVSAARLAAVGVSPHLESADLVFSYQRTAPLPPLLEANIRDAEVESRGVVVLNISGLIARRLDLLDDYREFAEHVHSRGFRVVFLPHVLRQGDDDLAQARRLFALASAPGDFLVEDELSPAQIQHLVRRSHCSVTGRMHLAIMSISQGTPAVTLATVGKVEGLYEMFNLPQLVVQPRRGCAADLIVALEAVSRERESIVEGILERLPAVRVRSSLNFKVLRGAVI